MPSSSLHFRRLLDMALAAILACGAAAAHAAADKPIPVKVMVISMFALEEAEWTGKLKLDRAIPVPGLSPLYPAVRCNKDDVCHLTTDMGKANAAASISALVFSGLFDLKRTYFLVAGIAGVDPARGTIGTAAWSRYLVDSELAWEVDARERPAGWSTGYLGINTGAPGVKPDLGYGTEVYKLDDRLADMALSLSRGVVLSDSPGARAYRAHYPEAPANQLPQVTQCDSMTGNNWFHGELLGQRAREWFKLLTDDHGTYCMSSQEDNATYTALKRGAEEGLLDLRRVAVLRTASNFDRQYPGLTALDSVKADSGGFAPAVTNLYLAGSPLVVDIVKRWPLWKDGVPQRDDSARRVAPKVMIVNMFGGEAAPFIRGLKLTTAYKVRGLSARYPEVHCNGEDVCQMTTDMGYSNAAASMTALMYASGFDLRQTYFIVAGIAGINPGLGTVGSTAWADYAVDYSLAHEIDAREMPSGWPSGYFGIFTDSPDKKPKLSYRTEVFQLDPALVARAYALSKDVALSDSPAAVAYRAGFPSAPANQPPAVLRCDTASSDTWFGGATLARRAQDWSALLTDGKARYCTVQQEDNSTLEALRRGGAAGKVDFKRVLILRAGSDTDRPHPGQSDSDVLVNYKRQGGFVPAAENLMITARPVIEDIVTQWQKRYR
jgi:purine nucleoside permease